MRCTHQEYLCADSDDRLVALAREGSTAAFEAIVLRYQEPLLRHCRQMLTPAEAEDAVQDAFLSAFRTIDRTGPDLRLGGWLFRIAHNAALGILRRRTSTLPLDSLPADRETGDDVLLRRVQLRDTLAAISTLPQTEQHALLQRALGGRGHREIALSLGRSEGAVRQLLHRARTRLRDCVAGLSPLVMRFAPSSGDDRLTTASLAAKGGAVLAVGVTAVGGGAAVLSAGPAHGGPNAPDARVASLREASAGPARTVSALPLRSASSRWLVSAKPRGAADHRDARATVRTTAPLSAHRHARSTSAPVHMGVTGRKGLTAHPQTATPHQRVAALSGSSTVRTRGAPATSSSTSPATTATGQRAAATGQPTVPRGESGMPPGRSGAAPGHAGAAPGQLGTAPGQPTAAPGPVTAPPGRSGAAPGPTGMPPGLSHKSSS